MSGLYNNLIARGWTRHEAFEEILRNHPPRETSRPGDIVVLMVHFGLHGGQYCYLSKDDIYSPGDLVEVNVRGMPQVVTVDAVGYYSKDEYPFGDLFVRTIVGPASGDLAEKYREAIEQEAQKSDDLEKELTEARRARDEAEAARKSVIEASQQLIETALTSLEDRIAKVTKKADQLLDEGDTSDHVRKEISKLYSKYLPQTKSIIEAYRELFQADIPLDEIETVRNAMLDAIAKSNDAYDAILQSLCMRDTISLYAEIKALKTLFAMDGLTAPDFRVKT